MNDFYNKQICSYKDIDRFGFTCDVCGRKINGCHYINGMSFCERCYQETFGKDNQQQEEIKQLKQELEACQEARKFEVENHNESYKKLFEKWANEVKELKQQLEQAQTRISELDDKDWFEATIKQLEEQNDRFIQERDSLKHQLKEKDNYHLRYELAGADETITNLRQQIEEKNKEIERLKFFEKAYYYNQLQASQEDIQKFQQLANQSAININYIAIQELEKVKKALVEENRKFPIVYDITDDLVGGAIDKEKVFTIIDQQIKGLKGE